MKPRDYQDAAVASIFQYFISGKVGNPIVALPTGCHARGQLILMFDGSVKAVELIQVGDLLMGPDSAPRKVLELYNGRQEMRRIVPNKGSPFIVNADHILALKRCKERADGKSSSFINISVSDFESKSKWFQHVHKLYRTGVDFSNFKELSVDPYFLGVFLGDGGYTQAQVGITSMDPEIIEYCKSYFEKLGDLWRTSNNGSKADTLWATTKIRNRTRRTKIAGLLDSLNLRGKNSNSKFIPLDYKTASRLNRLALLAGLLDTDGSNFGGGFDYCTVSKTLADDVLFLGRSLGFLCTVDYKLNAHSNYFRVTISGNCSEIPVLLERKKPRVRLQRKDILCTGFTIEKLPEDDYYGFELTGDRLYLLDDFTVTHNTGKSIVIGEFIRQVFEQYPYSRIMKLTHVKELIEQNLNKLLAIWPTAPAGVYSSGLKRKETSFPIIFGGIGSVAKKDLIAFGRIDLLLIDECQLVSPSDSTMYRKVIDGLKKINPYLKVIGFTATHYRLGQGMLTDPGGLFTDLCFDATDLDSFNWFIEQGYLASLIPKHTKIELDMSGVHMSGGEYKQNELQAAVDKDEVTFAACQEMLEYGRDRNCWLIFASGIEHTIHVAAMLDSLGVLATFVHSKMGDAERDKNLAEFKAGKYRAIVNNGILTTGFDHPPIDLIGMLRPTQSPSLWVQMLGRGTRPHYFPGFDLGTMEGRLASIQASDKHNCLVMDFAGNTRRLGPINDPVLPKTKGKGGGGTAPVKVCLACGVYNHASARFCFNCGEEFPKQVKIGYEAGTDALVASSAIVTEIFNVDKVTYAPHMKEGRPPSIKVNYYCGLRLFTSYLCLEHEGFAGKKARDLWRERSTVTPPTTTAEALTQLGTLKLPTHVRVWLKSGQTHKYDEILSYIYEDEVTNDRQDI
jgi:DNA repair protein RadD